jgi:uncharacterized protein (TIGR03435 family)
MLSHLADLSIRALVLALTAAVVLWASRGRRTAAMEHAVWTAVTVGMLGLFVFGSALPRLPLRVLRSEAVHFTQRPEVTLPAAADAPVEPEPAPQAPARREIDWIEMGYGAIALAFFARFALGMLLVRRLIAGSTPLGRLRESSRISVPLTVGWFRPAILLPTEWREWDRAKLDAVLTHEGAHVRRRDGLVAAIAGINRCIFWFHPLAWWLERRLAYLAELACDEACVAATGDREQYARLLVEMAQVVDGSHGRLRGHALTMAAGSHIRQRVESILQERRVFSRGLNWTGWAAIALCGVPVIWGAGAVTLEHRLAQVRAKVHFEVASVRPTEQQPEVGTGLKGVAGSGGGKGGPPLGCIPRPTMDAGRADFRCHSMTQLLVYAFGLLPDRIVGQDWGAFTQRFDIAAKPPEGAAEEQVPEMLLGLLEDRFKLAYHRENRDGPIIALVVAKGGPKLKLAGASTADVPQANANAPGMAMINGVTFRRTAIPNPEGRGSTVIMNTPAMGTVREAPNLSPDGIRHWEAPSISAEGLADLLTIAVGGDTPVRDMTGLVGRYQVELDVSMADFVSLLKGGTTRDEIADVMLRAGQDGLRKLGLQLEPRKGPIETIVVDHIEKTPTEN